MERILLKARYLQLTGQIKSSGKGVVNPLIIYNRKEAAMIWTSPKIIQIPIGMEINCYECAEL